MKGLFYVHPHQTFYQPFFTKASKVGGLSLWFWFVSPNGQAVFFRCTQLLSGVQLFDPRDCRPPGASVHEISQARILEWVAISSSSFSNPDSNENTKIKCNCKGAFVTQMCPCFWRSTECGFLGSLDQCFQTPTWASQSRKQDSESRTYVTPIRVWIL